MNCESELLTSRYWICTVHSSESLVQIKYVKSPGFDPRTDCEWHVEATFNRAFLLVEIVMCTVVNRKLYIVLDCLENNLIFARRFRFEWLPMEHWLAVRRTFDGGNKTRKLSFILHENVATFPNYSTHSLRLQRVQQVAWQLWRIAASLFVSFEKPHNFSLDSENQAISHWTVCWPSRSFKVLEQCDTFYGT